VLVQRRGIFTWLLKMLDTIGLRIRFVESRREGFLELDRTIAGFYVQNRVGFLLSTGLFFLGWLAEAVEVFVILYCLGAPVTVLTSLSIGGLAVFIKGGTFFIPGSLGAQDAGNLLLVTAFGYSEVSGITFALLRRFRELVWIGLGLVCLMLIGGKKGGGSGEESRSGVI
jgi:glycosyltransferase 2 family protein